MCERLYRVIDDKPKSYRKYLFNSEYMTLHYHYFLEKTKEFTNSCLVFSTNFWIISSILSQLQALHFYSTIFCAFFDHRFELQVQISTSEISVDQLDSRLDRQVHLIFVTKICSMSMLYMAHICRMFQALIF